MKYITILFCIINLQSIAQRKHQVGFYIAPLSQSAYTVTSNNGTTKVTDSFIPSFSLSIETGLFFTKKINERIALQHNLHFDIMYHSTQKKYTDFNNQTGTIISSDDLAYGLGYSPKVEFTPFVKVKNLQIIAGYNAKYFFDVPYENSGAIGLANGALLQEVMFASGTINNPTYKANNWKHSAEIGINYDVNLIKKRILLKVNPFYQHSFRNAYTGVYRYTNGSYIENGTFANKLHQTGVRLLFGFTY